MPNRDLEHLSDLIDRIYEASLEPKNWPGVVNGIAAVLSGSSAQLWTPQDGPDTGGFHLTMNIPESVLQQYVSHYHQHDLWRQEMGRRGLFTSGTVLTDEDLMPRRALLASPYYREFLTVANASRLCFVTIFGPELKNLRMTAMSVYRPVRATPFSKDAKRWMTLLTPHLSRALGVMYRLQDTEFRIAASHAALDRLNAGVILLGVSGEVVFANRTALQVIKAGDAIVLERGVDGRERLSARTPERTAAIRTAIAHALEGARLQVEHFAEGIRINRPGGLAPVMLNISVLPAGNQFGGGMRRPYAIAFIANTDQNPIVTAGLLKDLYGLSPAECRLVNALCSGETMANFSDKHRVSTETSRKQLKSVFAKTGANRQVDLVRLMLSLASSRA